MAWMRQRPAIYLAQRFPKRRHGGSIVDILDVHDFEARPLPDSLRIKLLSRQAVEACPSRPGEPSSIRISKEIQFNLTNAKLVELIR